MRNSTTVTTFSSKTLICKEQSYFLCKDKQKLRGSSWVLHVIKCKLSIKAPTCLFFRKIDVDDMIDLGEMTLGQGHDITTHFNVTSTPCALYVWISYVPFLKPYGPDTKCHVDDMTLVE